MSTYAFSPIMLINDNSARLVLKGLSLLLALTALMFFFYELPTVPQEDIETLIQQHDPSKLITHFATSLIPTVLSLVFSLCLALINCAAFIQWMIKHDQGYLIFLITGGSASALCLLIYTLDKGGEYQQDLLKAGAAGVGWIFGFLQGFNFRSHRK
jgi:hypothetical protein